MKNLFFLIVFFFTTSITFAQSKVWTDVNKINHVNNVVLKVKSKKISKNEIEVVYEFVDEPKGCYIGGCVFESNRKNYSAYNNTVGNVNPYSITYGEKPAFTYCPTNTYYPMETHTYSGYGGGQYYINSNGNRTYISR